MRLRRLRNVSTIRHRILEKLLFWGALIIAWQLIYYLGCYVLNWWKFYAFPSPLGVINTFISMLQGKALAIALLVSLKRGILGFFISMIIGFLMGMLLILIPFLNRNLKAVILGLQTLPSICWVPFAVLWYGINESAIFFVIIIGSTFAIALSVENAIQNTNPLYVRAAKTMGAKGTDLYLKVILPSCVPELISGLKQGWSFAWRALMAGEIMSASLGLGQILQMGRDLADINQVVVVMLIIIVIGVAIDNLIFTKIELAVRKKMGLLKTM